jgi:hypothetical protein
MKNKLLGCLFVAVHLSLFVPAQNLVVDGNISNTNANWGGGTSEAPYNNTTFENTYLTSGCASNYIMEVDFESIPQQTIDGFLSGAQYTISFRYAWRNTGCNASVNPTILRFEFSDATGVLSKTLSISNTVTTLTPYTFTFTNNSSTSHILKFSNPGNSNTCGVIIDDISIVKVGSPGGIGTANLSSWFNAANIGIADNTGIYGWIPTGTSLIAMTPDCNAPPLYRTGKLGTTFLTANFNPFISLNGNNQYLEYTGTRIDLLDATTGGTGGTFFAVHQGGNANNTYFANRGSNNSRIHGQTAGIALAQSTTTGSNNLAGYTTSARVNILSTVGKNNGISTRDQNGSTLLVSNTSLDVDYLTMGVRRTGSGVYNQFYNGAISEIISFNTQLSAAQMQRVRSYLATKYGVTLNDNSSTSGLDERNYVAADGITTYWSYSSNSTFHNNVTIIGRDDNTNLCQLKSISTNADATHAPANAMLMIDNGTNFTSNNSYFSTGHNGVSTTIQELIDVPASIQVRMKRCWKFQKTGAGVNTSVSLSFNMTGFSPLNGADLRLLVSTTTGFSSASIIAGTYSAPYFTVNLPTTGGVYYTLGSVNKFTTPLPVELLSFNAVREKNQVELKWITASEKNNDFFTIERSRDGYLFSALETIKGGGNSAQQLNYFFQDRNPYAGRSFYRLKQTDFDGRFTYSPVVAVDFNTDENSHAILAVTANSLTLQVNDAKGEAVTIAIYSCNGALCYTGSFIVSQEKEIRTFSLPKTLLHGFYVFSLRTQDSLWSRKFYID